MPVSKNCLGRNFLNHLSQTTDFEKSKVNFVMVMVEGRTTWRCQYILGDTVLYGSGSTKNSALDNLANENYDALFKVLK